MNENVLNAQAGFIGNTDSAITSDWLTTEVINKAKQGDETSVYKLVQFVRHGEAGATRDYALKTLASLGYGVNLPAKEVVKDEEEDET